MRLDDGRLGFKELSLPVKAWAGMITAFPSKTIGQNAFSQLLNMDFRGPNYLRTRKGTTQYTGNSVFGSSNEVVAGIEFKPTGSSTSKIIEATSDGKLYQKDKSVSSTPALIGSLANSTPTIVSMVQMADALYIADGVGAFKWDGSTLTNITSTFPSISPLSTGNVLYVSKTRSQVWWADDNDYLYASVPNDPDDLTTTANGAYKVQVSYGDGAQITSMVEWGNTLLINKVDDERDFHTMYWIRGTGSTSDPYRVEDLAGTDMTPTAFLGKSAVELRGDVIGLTMDGVTTVSAIQNFRESKLETISAAISDVIERINFNVPHKINGIYDTITKQYMLAVPLDGATSVTHVLIYDVDGDRWSMYNNWDVRCWERIGTDIMFGTEDGRVVKTRSGDSDEGSGFTKQVVTGDFDAGNPDIIKLFKSLEVDIQHEGDYTVDYYFAIDNVEITTAVSLTLDIETLLWDEFYWDQDKWDNLGNTIRNILILGRGRTIRHKFVNENASEPFTLVSMADRIVRKDSGQAKVS